MAEGVGEPGRTVEQELKEREKRLAVLEQKVDQQFNILDEMLTQIETLAKSGIAMDVRTENLRQGGLSLAAAMNLMSQRLEDFEKMTVTVNRQFKES